MRKAKRYDATKGTPSYVDSTSVFFFFLLSFIKTRVWVTGSASLGFVSWAFLFADKNNSCVTANAEIVAKLSLNI